MSDNTKTFQATEKALNELFNHPEVQADFGFGLGEGREEVQFRKGTLVGGFFEQMVASVKDCL